MVLPESRTIGALVVFSRSRSGRSAFVEFASRSRSQALQMMARRSNCEESQTLEITPSCRHAASSHLRAAVRALRLREAAPWGISWSRSNVSGWLRVAWGLASLFVRRRDPEPTLSNHHQWKSGKHGAQYWCRVPICARQGANHGTTTCPWTNRNLQYPSSTLATANAVGL